MRPGLRVRGRGRCKGRCRVTFLVELVEDRQREDPQLDKFHRQHVHLRVRVEMCESVGGAGTR